MGSGGINRLASVVSGARELFSFLFFYNGNFTMIRHFALLLHRYAGLYMAFFLVVAGLTGSILALDDEIYVWLNPPITIIPQSGPQLDEFTLRERAEAMQPQGKINSLSFTRKADQAYTVNFEPRVDPNTGSAYALTFNQLSLNPYTGAEIARETSPSDIWPVNRKNLLMLVVRLHYQLALPGSIGTWLFGIAALIWTFDCFVGAYLTFPLSIRQSAKVPQRNWLSRWKIAWLVKWRASAMRINFDLHRAGGLWIWAMLLVMAWTGVGFNLGEQVYMPVMTRAFNLTDLAGGISRSTMPLPESALDWRKARQTGQQLMAEQAKRNGFAVLHEVSLSFQADKSVFYYAVKSDLDMTDAGGGTAVYFDASTGQLLKLVLPSGQFTGNTIHNWLYALHMATLWGLPYKFFLSLVGLMVAMLSVTGVIIYFKKRRARKSARSHRLEKRVSPNML